MFFPRFFFYPTVMPKLRFDITGWSNCYLSITIDLHVLIKPYSNDWQITVCHATMKQYYCICNLFLDLSPVKHSIYKGHIVIGFLTCQFYYVICGRLSKTLLNAHVDQ